MNERKLATIQQIDEINPIENSDNLEVATVKGWKVVTQKGQYQPGDLCIYCEIDSFLPDTNPDFEFLKKTSHRKMGDRTGYRLKTIKLRGQVSQGLLLPFGNLETGTSINIPSEWAELTGLIGKDVTEQLGIVKWEPPIPAELDGVMKGNFPSFIPKTDEERIQNMSKDYENLKAHTYTVTEKIDGSSCTMYFRQGEFGVCSRNLDLVENEFNSFWKVARELQVEERLRVLGEDIALQGELHGEGIQGNKYKLKGQTIRFFTGFDITTQQKFTPAGLLRFLEESDFAERGPTLQSVPVIDKCYKLPDTMDELLKFAEGKSALNPQTEREGLVFRSNQDPKISFKVISNRFLLKSKDD
jgi:RNA ligase (TIGR02306 family)